MVFEKVEHRKIARSVVSQIETLILEGVLRSGDRLPPERELAGMLDVSRPILRDGISELQDRGILIARQGGGTFVGDVLGHVFSEQVIELFGKHRKARSDYLEFRRENDAIAAGYAAARATEADREMLQSIHERLCEAHEDGDLAKTIELDVSFHIAIAEAAHNLVLLHTMRNIYELLVSGVFYDRITYYGDDRPRRSILRQHEDILAAILAGDCDSARTAAAKHVSFVEETLDELDETRERQEVSLRRLAKLQEAAGKAGKKD